MILLLLLAGIAQSINVTLDWNVGWVTVSPDGFTRQAIGVNGIWPIPTVRATIGDMLIIKVTNSLATSTSLHSHGTNFYDGATGLTQCGIPPTQSFTYKIKVAQVGSYWIHGHSDGQYVDGFRTALVLLPLIPSPIPDFVVGIQDWYHQLHRPLLDQFLSIYNPTGAEPIPDTPLINHKVNEIFSVAPNSTYRLRFISMAAFSMFNIWIDDHNMTIIEVDGVDVEPYQVSSLSLAAAQRVSVLITTSNSTSFNYAINSEFNTAMFDGPSPPIIRATALLQYSINATLSPAISITPTDDLIFQDETLLTPTVPMIVVPADNSIVLNVAFDLYTDGSNHGAFNKIPWVFPKVLPIFTVQMNQSNSPAIYGVSTQTQVLKSLEMVQVLINNLDTNSHPFHIHGHVFQIVSKGLGVYKDGGNFLNPVRRDTVVVPAGGFAMIRFRADNPGVWFFHCHIEWHLQSGLALQFLEAPEVLQKSVLPEEVYGLCKMQGVQTFGNFAGYNDSTTLPEGGVGVWPNYLTGKGVAALVGCIVSALGGGIVLVWFS